MIMNENKRIAINSVIIFIRLVVVSLIGLITSRLVLQALGADNYGLYNVVGGIVTLLNVVNTAMVSTTYRYIAYEMGRKEGGNTNRVFNTSFAIHAAFAIFIILLGLPIGQWYVSNHLNVVEGSLPDAHFVLLVSIITTALNTAVVPYRGLMTAYENFHIPALFDIICQSVKLGAIFVLLYASGNKIKIYSLIMLGYNVLEAAMYLTYCFRHYLETIRFKLYHDWILVKEMFSFSVWILIGAGASVGKTQGSAMIINYFFGTLVNAAFAIANQVENVILMFSRMLNNAAVPQITKNFSGGNQQRSVKLASYISKYTFILMTLVAFPFIMEMDFILGIWLKDVPEGSKAFCQLMVLGGLIGCMGEGIPALTQASGKIKYFQVILSSITLLGLPISIVCYKLGAAPYSILLVFCLISFVNAIVRLLLLNIILKIDIKYFITTSYFKMVLISIPLIIAFLFYNPSTFSVPQHLLGLVLMELFLVSDIIILGTDKEERAIIKDKFKTVKIRLSLK